MSEENLISMGGDRASALPKCCKCWQKSCTYPARFEASPAGMWRWKHNSSQLGFRTSVYVLEQSRRLSSQLWMVEDKTTKGFVNSFLQSFIIGLKLILWKKIRSLEMSFCVCREGGFVILGCCCAVISGPRIKNLIILRKSFSFCLRRRSTAAKAKFRERFHPSV